MSYSSKLFILLILKAFALTLVIFYSAIELGPDEAQYWTWSQLLDWGYYSKPPGIAWQIKLGTFLFGETEWGVRSLSIVFSIGQAYLVFLLAKKAGLSEKTSFWAALLMAFTPLGIIGSIFAITDVGFLFFWTAACLTAIERSKEPKLLKIGVLIACGALFKWPIYLFWMFALTLPRSLVSTSKFLLGVLISLLGLLPSLWWNAHHEWATFKHVFATVQGGSVSKATGNLGEFIASQSLLLSPIIFILLLLGCCHLFTKRRQLAQPLHFCGLITVTSLALACLASCFQKIQGNWMILAYPTGFIILGWDVFENRSTFWRRTFVKLGLGISLMLTCLLALPYLPFRDKILKHNSGWHEINDVLMHIGYNPSENYLFSDKYQTTSLLSFYGPEQERAYFLNLQGVRHNQFTYWPQLQEERQGQIGYFVWIETQPKLEKELEIKKKIYGELLKEYFEGVEIVGIYPLIKKGEDTIKGALVVRCSGWKGKEMLENQLF